VSERYDRITGTKAGSRLLQSMFKQQPKLRKFVRANEQPIELNDQEKKLLKQIANLFSGAPGMEKDMTLEVTSV
jgi:hypothetical protein